MEVRESASSTVGTNVPGAAWSVRSPRRAETARLIARAATFAGPCCWGARSPSDRSSCWPVRRDGARSCAAAKSRSCSRRSAALMRRCAVVVMPLMCAGHVRDGRTAGHGLRRPLPGAGPPRPGVATPWHAKVLPALASATVSRRQTVATAVAMVEAMGELLYEGMDPDQAADALDEFIAERGAALEHLRSVLAAEGLDPHTTLDHTVESVARVWETITARAARLGVNPRSLEDDPTRPSWPSWARHGMLVDPYPPAATLALVDGFTSCLSRLFTSAVPGSAWIVGEHRIADHPMRDHPVLATGHHMVFVPPFPLYRAYQSAHGRPPAGRGRDDRPAARPRRGRVGPPLRTGCPGGDCPVLGRDEAEAVVRLVAGATPAAMNRHRLVAATAIVVAVLAAVRSGTRRPRQRVERTTARA